MLSITDIALEIEEALRWQETPQPISHLEYKKMVIRGVKRLFIDTGRAALYDENLLDAGENGWTYDYKFLIDEERYIILCAQIEFFRKVQTDVNKAMGYTTDALSVTGADKPFAHLQGTINDLEAQRRELYYRMVRYTLIYPV